MRAKRDMVLVCCRRLECFCGGCFVRLECVWCVEVLVSWRGILGWAEVNLVFLWELLELPSSHHSVLSTHNNTTMIIVSLDSCS